MSACTRRRARPVGDEHPVTQVDRDRLVAGTCDVDAQVARPARQIEDAAAGIELEGAYGSPPPPYIEAKRHDPVDEVVPRRDRVEHVAHGADLVVTLGERFAIP